MKAFSPQQLPWYRLFYRESLVPYKIVFFALRGWQNKSYSCFAHSPPCRLPNARLPCVYKCFYHAFVWIFQGCIYPLFTCLNAFFLFCVVPSGCHSADISHRSSDRLFSMKAFCQKEMVLWIFVPVTTLQAVFPLCMPTILVNETCHGDSTISEAGISFARCEGSMLECHTYACSSCAAL